MLLDSILTFYYVIIRILLENTDNVEEPINEAYLLLFVMLNKDGATKHYIVHYLDI